MKYSVLKRGQYLAIDFIKPGLRVNKLFSITMESIHKMGMTNYERQHVGHGIGLEPYEAPILNKSSSCSLDTGMVLSIETPYYEFGFGALSVEDQVVVTQDDARLLSENDNNLLIRK